MLLDGKVALVTGASRGIGRAVALKLASERKETAICAVLMESGRGSAGKGQELSLEDDWDDW